MFLIYLTFILCALPRFKFCFYNCGYDQSVINIFYLTKKNNKIQTLEFHSPVAYRGLCCTLYLRLLYGKHADDSWSSLISFYT